MRIWVIPYSTNVERISLALGHKGLDAEVVEVDAEDRSEIVRVSGQDLAPVMELGGRIFSDSPVILRELEELHPNPPLWPSQRSRRAEVDIFIDWFNRVWKLAPNAIADELAKPEPEPERIDAAATEMATHLGYLESLLDGGDHLLGDFGAADCVAFPFLKYAAVRDPDDDELFHRVLEDYQPLGDNHPRLRAWIERVNERQRAF